MIEGWRYYNHAIVPTTLPHEEINKAPLEDGSIWEIQKKAILVRWTSDFDCAEETDWWYVLREGPYNIEDFSTHHKKHIRQAMKKCTVRRIDPVEMAEEICRVHVEAISRYQNYDKNIDTEAFTASLKRVEEGVDWWGAFLAESDTMAGYMKIRRKGDTADLVVSKFSSLHLNARVSDALYHTILDYYLNEEKMRYVNSGEKSISHITNTQDYKVSEFHYRQVYCKLNVMYNPKYKWMIKMMYPLRGFLKLFKKVSLVDNILSVLKMEEIVRRQEKKK